jgi:signal transduction histidine kinase/CheY-like chemotaxis protein
MLFFIKESIASKITLFITILVMTVASFVGIVFYFSGIDYVVENDLKKLRRHGETISNSFAVKWKGYQEQGELLSDLSKSSSSFRLILDKKFEYNDNWLEIRVVNQDKNIIYQRKKFKQKKSPLDGFYIETNSVALGQISPLKISQDHTSSVLPVIISLDKKTKLVILEKIDNFFEDIKTTLSVDEKYIFFDDQGQILIHPWEKKSFGIYKGTPYRIDEEMAFLAQSGFLHGERKNLSQIGNVNLDKSLIHIRKITFPGQGAEDYLGVAVYQPYSIGIVNLQNLRLKTILISLVMTVLTALLAWFVSSYLLKNLNEITHLAKLYAQGEIEVSIPVKSSDEIGILAKTFQSMINQVNERTRVLRKRERQIREARDQAENALTSKSHLLDNIRLQKMEIESVSRDKDELLAIVSHDLKNPLAVIETSMDILGSEDNIMSSEVSVDLVRRSKNASRLALNLITDLLDLARLEGGIRLDFEKFSVTELIQSVTDSFYLKAKEKKIEFVIEADDSLDVYADYGRVVQVLSNIIGNSLKFTPEKGTITIITKKIESQKSDTEDLLIEIADNGPGIPKEKIDKIFNKFEQAREKDRKIGTGLGLAICKNIVELHGGDIWVESEEYKGAKFSILLPKVYNYSEDETNILKIRDVYTVLFANDCEPLRSKARRKITEKGFNYIEAKNGEEVLQILENQEIDLLVLDHTMPVKDGPETLKAILASKNELTPFILYVLDDNHYHDLKFVQLNTTEVVGESLGIDVVTAKVTEILNPKVYNDDISLEEENTNTVLIVDEEEAIRDLIAEKLESMEINAIKAKNGVEALFMIKKYQIDLIITDIRVQEIDGATFPKVLQRECPTTPIILMSTTMIDMPSNMSEKLGVVYVLSKPFQLSELEDVVCLNLIKTKQEMSQIEESETTNIDKGGEGKGDEKVIKIRSEEVVKKEKKPKADREKIRILKKEVAQEVQEIQEKTSPTRNRILLVDDSDDMQMIFKVLMRKEDVDIDVASNGQEGVDFFLKHKYKVVFMDINMPVMKGDEAIQKIRAYEKENNLDPTWVVMMSANDTTQDIEKFMVYGFDTFIKKPLNKDKIVENILKAA